MKQHLDTASTTALAVARWPSALGLFSKGFGHDLLLEGGVSLVPVCRVIPVRRMEITGQARAERLARIGATLSGLEDAARPTGATGAWNGDPIDLLKDGAAVLSGGSAC